MNTKINPIERIEHGVIPKCQIPKCTYVDY